MSAAVTGGAGVTAQAMLSFAVALGARERHEVYLSTPITTGEAFLRWRRSTGTSIDRDHPRYRELHRQAVVHPNIARALPMVEQLRSTFPDRLVINPAALADVSGWEQDDYHSFWCAVVDRFAEIVVFADGWQSSAGCVIEFVTALESGARMLDQKLEPLTGEAGAAMVADAVAELEYLAEDSSRLRRSLARLERSR